MSGPVDDASAITPDLGISAIEVREGRSTRVGRFGVLRVLPTKGRRTVGPWCFVDLMNPDDIGDPPPIEIGPHPHIGLATATWLFVGALGTAASPAGLDHPTIGLDVTFRSSVEVPADPRFEYGVVPIDQTLRVDDAIVDVGSLALIPTGYERLSVESRSGPARMLVLGGEPLGVEIKMWWNFVARTLDEITDAWRAWRDHDDDRFGPVPSSLARIEAPAPPWLATPA